MSAEAAAVNRYTVREAEGDQGWDVVIADPEGAEVWRRACRTETEARTYASTVIQHLGWLSPDKFRQYYRLEP